MVRSPKVVDEDGRAGATRAAICNQLNRNSGAVNIPRMTAPTSACALIFKRFCDRRESAQRCDLGRESRGESALGPAIF